jgi:lysophospholipase L1-like esterase
MTTTFAGLVASGSRRCAFVATVALAALWGGEAVASTITQNVSWTIKRDGTADKYRVVAYGDSIYAGYYGSISYVAVRAAPHAVGEYAGTRWNAVMEVIRRTKSGAKADDIYKNKIVGERSYMQASNTRAVIFEMCGNDYLQARSAFRDQTGTCNYGPLSTALNNCTYYMEQGMKAINTYAKTAKVKVIANLYYPGYNADDRLSNCTDSSTGQKVNTQETFLPYLARSNWRACNLASRYGFQCADGFAEYMGADYDSNGDGIVDSDGLRYIAGESEADYVTRIASTRRSTIRDSNTHFVNSSTSYDYLQSDDVHPTYHGSSTVYVGLFGGTGSGSAYALFKNGDIVDGKNPVWNRTGHERLGWANSVFLPAAP